MTKPKPSGWPRIRLKCVGLVRLVSALLTVIVPAQILHAADAATSPTPVTSSLEYQETEFGIANWPVSFTTQTEPFTKEQPAEGRIVRGSLSLGASNAVSFVWQRDAGKFFLDLNRNQDLTDDPAGVFSTPAKSRIYQSFTKIRLPVQTDRGRCQILADIDLWDYSQQPGCNLTVRSFWQGKVTLNGKDWQIGMIPAISYAKRGNRSISFETGHLLLRPWAKRNQSFNNHSGSVAVVPFARKLFMDDHAYQLDWVVGAQNSEVKLAIQFAEQTVELGELRITGKYIQRLVLTGQPYLVILDQPAAMVKVPVGSYNQPTVRLEQGGKEAFYDPNRRPTGRRISVTAKTPADLAIGGPLTNSVSVTRRGQDLSMDYRLIGVGGMAYQLGNQNYSDPPGFAVFKADKKIASGNFEFG